MLCPRKFFLVRWMYAVHPNWYTVARVAGVFPLLFLITRGSVFGAFILFLVLAATDILDGHVARATGKVTPFGKFFDPMADKIFLLTTLFVLLPVEFSLIFAVLVTMEIALFGTSLLAYTFPEYIGKALGANVFGKYKAFGEMAIIATLLGGLLDLWRVFQQPLAVQLVVVIGCAVLSLIGHLRPVFLSQESGGPL